jgi:hypothetical protein
VNAVTIDIGGIRTTGEVLSVQPVPLGRTLLQIRSADALDRGRTCTVRGPSGKQIECVISTFVPMDGAYVIEMRCLGDASFLKAELPPQ